MKPATSSQMYEKKQANQMHLIAHSFGLRLISRMRSNTSCHPENQEPKGADGDHNRDRYTQECPVFGIHSQILHVA